MKSYILAISISVCAAICTTTTVVFVQSSYNNKLAATQSVCKADLKFTGITARYPGGVIRMR